MELSRKHNFILSIFLVLVFSLSFLPAQTVLAKNAGSGTKAFNFIGYRYLDNTDLEVFFDKNNLSFEKSQFKIFEGSGTGGEELTIATAYTGLDTNIIASGLSQGASVILNTADGYSFIPGTTYSVALNNTIVSGNGNGLTLGSYLQNQDVIFSFTAPMAGDQVDLSWAAPSLTSVDAPILPINYNVYASEDPYWDFSKINVALNTDTSKINLTLNTGITSGKVVTLDYVPGKVKSSDKGVLEGFSGQAVTNLVLSGGGGSGVVLPTVVTGGFANVQASKATIQGNVTSDGGGTITERGIAYAKTGNPTVSDSYLADSAGGTGSFSLELSGLTSSTLYYARAYATNSAGTAYGGSVSFTTTQANPINFLGCYLTTAQEGDFISDTGDQVTNGSSVPKDAVFKLVFNKNVTNPSAFYNGVSVLENNLNCILLQTSSGSSVPVQVFNVGSGQPGDIERMNLFLKPDADLTAGEGYKIIILPNLISNNGLTLGSELSINFSVYEPSPKYTVAPVVDSFYTVGKTAGGIDRMTVNDGVSGLKYFKVTINTVIEHTGDEELVFTLLRNGAQINLNAVGADFDLVHSATAGFNILPGDEIRAYLVDNLTNDINFNPTVLE